MARADEIVRDTLKDNRASYSYLNTCGTRMYFEFPDVALGASSFPLLVCQKVAHSGTPWALGGGNQRNRTLVQIDIYMILNDYETVSTVKYYDNHLLKKIATDVFTCLRAKIYDTSGVFRYVEISDRRMPEEEIEKFPAARRTLEIELLLKDAE